MYKNKNHILGIGHHQRNIFYYSFIRALEFLSFA